MGLAVLELRGNFEMSNHSVLMMTLKREFRMILSYICLLWNRESINVMADRTKYFANWIFTVYGLIFRL